MSQSGSRVPWQKLAEAEPGVQRKSFAKAARVATTARAANAAKATKAVNVAKAAIYFSLIAPDSLLAYSYLTFGPIIVYSYYKLIQVL